MVSPVRLRPVTTRLVWATLVMTACGSGFAGGSAPASGFHDGVERRGPDANRSATRGTCAAAHSKTLAETSRVRIYSVRARDRDRDIYGCYLPSGRRTRLVDGRAQHGGLDGSLYEEWLIPGTLSVRAQYVGFGFEWFDAGESGYEVTVYDLRSRRDLAAPRNWDDSEILAPSDLELGPHGSMAWIAAPWSPGDTPREPPACTDPDLGPCTVYAFDSQSRRKTRSGRYRGARVVETSETILPRSLQRRRDTVSWVNDNQTRSVVLVMPRPWYWDPDR